MARRTHGSRELSRVPIQTLEASFGPRGIDLSRAALGHDPRSRNRHAQAKPIKREATLEQLFYDPRAIRASLGRLVAAIGLDVRTAGMQPRQIGLEMRYPDTPPTNRRKRIPPTDLDAILEPIVKDMFESAFVRRVRIRGMALFYGDLVARDDQMRFAFASDKTNVRRKNLEKAMDKIRGKYGVETIGPGTWRAKIALANAQASEART